MVFKMLKYSLGSLESFFGSRPSAAATQAISPLPTSTTFALVLSIALSALLLRFVNLDEWSLWVDELYGVRHAAGLADGELGLRSLAYVPTLVGLEATGVNMATLDADAIWTWQSAGVTEWKMRAPVALLGGVTILVLGLASVRVFGQRETLLLCLLMALSPWHLWMSQVGRFYMQLFLLYNLALLLYYQATETGRLRPWLLSVTSGVLAFYTTPIALMIVGVVALDFVLSWLRSRPINIPPSFWVSGAIGMFLCVFSAAYSIAGSPETYTGFSGSPQSIPLMTVGMVYMVGVPMVVMAVSGFWSLLHHRRERLAILLAAAALMPLAIFIVFNILGKDTHVRYIFVALFPWLALAAVGMELIITSMRVRWNALIAWVPIVALLSSYLVSDYIYMTDGRGYRPPWQQAMEYVQWHRQPGELVAGDRESREMALFYLQEPDTILLPRDISRSTLLHSLLAPTWIIYYVSNPSRGDRTSHLESLGMLELKAHFSNHGTQPHHAVNVYYYRHPAAENTQKPS